MNSTRDNKILKEFASKMRNYFDGNLFLLYRIESDKFAVIPKNKMDTKDFFDTCKDFLEKIDKTLFFYSIFLLRLFIFCSKSLRNTITHFINTIS